MFGAVPEGVELVPWSLASAPDRAEQIDAVLVPNRFDFQVGDPVLQGLPNLKFVQLTSAGYDHALPFIPEGAVVSNGRGIHDDETAELAVGLLLASFRGIDVAIKNMKTRQWNTVFQPSLADRSVLLVGYGSIGKAIAARLEPFGVTITAVARTGRVDGSRTVHPMSDLRGLLPRAEAVILSVPLTEETRRLVDAEFIDLLPRGARIVNVARGAVVDTDALVAALTARRVFAALDVTEPEPLPERHPLWATPNTIITPHVGGHTTATQSRTLALFRRQIEALAEGRPLENVVKS
ncbi:2-hydroxyacid dehydrogenase [Conyzicola nivalis]|uniref:Dehydrogenase n=2 Tax=Conyzicola nivalis TaxID=1477021 RepID=A0A916WN02_9MICO|nr:dehydrogenase [Conyzicola nivalis]